MLGLGLGCLLALAPTKALAQGGPPLITDDPDTPGPGYWEVNVATAFERSAHDRTLEAPLVDVNYGVGRRIQLKFEVPWIRLREVGEPAQSGAGNSRVGVKWRFVGQEGQKLAWSIYPQIEFNNGHSSVVKGLVDDGSQLLLPTEITLEIAHVEINGEIGRNFVHDGEDQWLYGISTEGHVVPRLELLAELHGERHAASPTELVAQIGAREKITGRLILLLAVGHAVHGPNDAPTLLFYSGLQFNLPGRFDFGRPPEPRRRAP